MHYQRLTYSGLEPSQAFDIVYGAHFEHRLLAPGRSTFEHQRLMLEGTRLETGRYDFPVIARGAMPRDTVCIGMVADGIELTRYNATSIDAEEIQLYPPGVDLLYHAADASRWVLFAVSESRLQETALACTGQTLALPRRDAVSIRLRRGGRGRLVQLSDDALAIGRNLYPNGMSAALASEIATGLISRFVDEIHEGSAYVNNRTNSSTAAKAHFHLILACERLALSVDDVHVGLDDIARRSGYSRRALELIFRRSVGMPPGRWFMNMRLNGALRELLTPTPKCSVADVATRWGFRHLPRFAEQYRNAFGELPRQTLSRARASNR